MSTYKKIDGVIRYFPSGVVVAAPVEKVAEEPKQKPKRRAKKK